MPEYADKLKLTLRRKGVLLVAVPIFFELLFVVLLMTALQHASSQLEQQTKAKSIINASVALSQSLYKTGSLLGGYGQSRSALAREGFDKGDRQVQANLQELRSLIGDDPEQVNLMGELTARVEAGRTFFAKMLNDIEDSPPNVAAFRSEHMYRDIRSITDDVDDLARKLTEPQKKREQEVAAASEHSSMLVTILIVGLVANIVITVVLALYFTRDIVRRINVIIGNAMRLSAQKPLSEPLRGPDEIVTLDHAFHNMADILAEARRKERAILTNTVDVICAIDGSLTLTEVSGAAAKAWGYEPEELIGKRILSLLASGEATALGAALEGAQKNQEVLKCETGFRHKDGRHLQLQWSGAWSREDGTYYCVVHDVTEERKLEQLKRDFVAMVSHDLRTPLTAVQAFLLFITDGFYGQMPDKLIEKANRSSTEVDRLISLINNLLDIEKMEAGKMQIDPEYAIVSQIIERAFDSVHALSEKTKVELESKVGNDEIFVDVDQIMQVLVNLLSNAIKFSPEGSKVTVTSKEIGDSIEISIIDRGRGIPAAAVDKIFNRFEQVESADQKRKKGTGLGLPICKAIIESHEGKIGVDSKEGEGSRFWIQVPKMPPMASDNGSGQKQVELKSERSVEQKDV